MKFIGLDKGKHEELGKMVEYVESLNLGVKVEKVVYNREDNELHTRLFLEDGRSSHQRCDEHIASYSMGYLYGVLRANSKKKVLMSDRYKNVVGTGALKFPGIGLMELCSAQDIYKTAN